MIRFVFTLVYLILVIVLTGLALEDMWGWFIVPLGAVAIGQWHALGLATMIRMCTYIIPRDEMERLEDSVYYPRMITSLLVILAGWGMAWLYHAAMVT